MTISKEPFPEDVEPWMEYDGNSISFVLKSDAPKDVRDKYEKWMNENTIRGQIR